MEIYGGIMNKAVLVGRICKDIELRYTKNGKATTDFIIAVNRNYKNINGEYETDFINITVYGPTAENIASFCRKGDMIGIEGGLRHDVYETENGKRSKDYILAEKVMFLSPKGE